MSTVSGPVVRLDFQPTGPDAATGSPDREYARALAALSGVAQALRELGLRTPAAASILEAQAMMAEDPVLAERVRSFVDGGKSAEEALRNAFDSFRPGVAAAGRAADLDDVCRRAVWAAQGTLPGTGGLIEYPHVVVALDLAPADLAALEESVIAIVTAQGGPTSHTAILARAMGIPAVTGWTEALSLRDGEVVTVDSDAGVVSRGVTTARPVATPVIANGGPQGVLLQANIGSSADIAQALSAGAQGVGLLRSEFMTGYAEVIAAFPGKPVVIRVFDAGADKPLPFLAKTQEPNPSLGVRGLRALRAHPDVLTAQLRAIAEAGGAQVMAPMVGDQQDAAWFAAQARSFGLSPGAMIEVPAAAVLAREILSEVDFVSVGTNDLVQYTLAADRQLAAMAPLQNPWHPAGLRLISWVGQAAQATGKPAGVCGEAAADPRLAPVLVGLGMSSLSMSPHAIAAVRAALSAYTLEQCRELAQNAIG